MHTYHLGIDVADLDCALRRPDTEIRHKVGKNGPAGLERLRQWLKSRLSRRTLFAWRPRGSIGKA